MRLHTDKVTFDDLYSAASVSQTQMERFTDHRSSVRDHAFEIKLLGTEDAHSARRPNDRQYRAGTDVYAATWDQWGVFLRHLYEIDPMMICGTPKRPTYSSVIHFNTLTDGRFKVNAAGAAMWPRDEHGDHRWLPGSEMRTRECAKFTARQVYSV